MSDALSRLAMLADGYKALREQRLEAQRSVDELHEKERSMKKELIEALTAADGVSGISGATCRVSLTHKTAPVVNDWGALHAYIKANDAFDLLHRRVSDTAVAARWAEGEQVPGVGSIPIVDLSVRKL